VERLLSFCALGLDPEGRTAVFSRYDSRSTGKLNRMEFCRLCANTLWEVPEDLLEKMTDNLIAISKAKKSYNRRYWTEMADWIERKCRIVIPLAYFFVLIILFNIDMSDVYSEDNTAQMFSGVTEHTSITSTGIIYIIVYVICVLICVGLAHFANRQLEAEAAKTAVVQKTMARQITRRLSSADLTTVDLDAVVAKGDAVREAANLEVGTTTSPSGRIRRSTNADGAGTTGTGNGTASL
jgi:hypothetical protein